MHDESRPHSGPRTASRVDADRYLALVKENSVLARALGQAQARCTRVIAAQAAEIDRLHARLMQQQASLIVKTSQLAYRESHLASHRHAVAPAGGPLVQSHSGLPDRVDAPDPVWSAADVVICQTGCLSHDAYWRVQSFCTRMGTPCLFVDNPSPSSLARRVRTLASQAILPIASIAPEAPQHAAEPPPDDAARVRRREE